jgi:ABC-2 type transport system permease protein
MGLVIRVVVCLIFIIAGLPGVTSFVGWLASVGVVNGVASFSFLTHFAAITMGYIDARDLVFFASLLACFLFANAIILDAKKAD